MKLYPLLLLTTMQFVSIGMELNNVPCPSLKTILPEEFYQTIAQDFIHNLKQKGLFEKEDIKVVLNDPIWFKDITKENIGKLFAPMTLLILRHSAGSQIKIREKFYSSVLKLQMYTLNHANGLNCNEQYAQDQQSKTTGQPIYCNENEEEARFNKILDRYSTEELSQLTFDLIHKHAMDIINLLAQTEKQE